MNLSVVILAAGKGSRMSSSVPKVLHEIMGMPMLGHVLQAVINLKPSQIIVVTGYQSQLIEDYLDQQNIANVMVVKQEQQLGTGHALLQALPHITTGSQVLTVVGDVPGLVEQDLQLFLQQAVGKLGLITTVVDQPQGLGRIQRDHDNNLIEVVEEINTSSQQKLIKEVNTGIVTAPIDFLKSYLPQVEINKVKQEYYLLDVLPFWLKKYGNAITFQSNNAQYLFGVNDALELYSMQHKMQKRLLWDLLKSGVKFYDINRVDIRGDIKIDPGVVIDVNVILSGTVNIASGSNIGAGAVLNNCDVGKNVIIKPYSVCDNVSIAAGAEIGPFASLSSNSIVGEESYIGSFVEVKRSKIGANVKAKHLAYLGDATIEDSVNIGAGVITCNYDGANKHNTIIKKNSFVGAAVTLVAPIVIENKAFIAAGTTLRVNAPANKLAIAAVKPRFLANWARPQKYTVELK